MSQGQTGVRGFGGDASGVAVLQHDGRGSPATTGAVGLDAPRRPATSWVGVVEAEGPGVPRALFFDGGRRGSRAMMLRPRPSRTTKVA